MAKSKSKSQDQKMKKLSKGADRGKRMPFKAKTKKY